MTSIQRGKVIKDARLKKRMYQKDLGTKLGLKVATISGYELGTRNPDIDTLISICTELEISPSEIGFPEG